MAAAIGLRVDHTADDLRRLAKASRDAKQTRRLLALAAIYDGGSRTEAARIGGVGLQVVRDGVMRWRLVDLAAWLREEFGVTASRQTLGRELRRMGYRSLSARPQAHGQDPEAMEAFKKTSRPPSRKSAIGTPAAPASRSGSRTRRGSARRT